MGSKGARRLLSSMGFGESGSLPMVLNWLDAGEAHSAGDPTGVRSDPLGKLGV